MRLKKSIKNKISSLVIYTTTFAGMFTLGTSASTINSKIKLDKDINQKKIEYYEEQTRINNILIRQQLNEYNNKLEKFRENQIRELYKEIVYIPDEYRYQIISAINNKNGYNNGVILQEDLNKIESLELPIGNTMTFSFLKNCKNLEELKITCNKEDIVFLNYLPVLTNVKKLELNTDIDTFNSDIMAAIYQKIPYIEDLNLSYPTTYEPGVIESIKQLKKLTIKPALNCDINFNELKNLEELVIDSENPYDIAIWLNSEEYNTLKSNNVKITFKENVEEKYLEISQKLDDILNSLQINENSSDDEILNEILKYAVKNYQYDETVAKATKEEKKEMGIDDKFYKGGELYAIFEKDTQICGNYAAYVEAMYDRIKKPEQSYILTSVNHAWNLIDIENKKYYVDSTWLDNGILMINEEYLTSEEAADKNLCKYMHWYKEDPESEYVKENQSQQESHITDNMVQYEENTYTKTDFKITTPVITTTTATTTTHPVLTISTEKINTEKFNQEKLELENMYNKQLKASLKLTTLFLTISIFSRIKRKTNNKEKKLVK